MSHAHRYLEAKPSGDEALRWVARAIEWQGFLWSLRDGDSERRSADGAAPRAPAKRARERSRLS